MSFQISFKFSLSLTDTYDQSAVTSNLRRRIRSRDSFTRIKQLSGRNTSSMYSEIWRRPSRNSLIHLKTRHNTQTYCLLVYRMWTFSKLVLVTCSKYNLGKRDPTFPESLIMTLYSSPNFGAVSVTLNTNERHFDAEPCHSDSLRSKVFLHPSITTIWHAFQSHWI